MSHFDGQPLTAMQFKQVVTRTWLFGEFGSHSALRRQSNFLNAVYTLIRPQSAIWREEKRVSAAAYIDADAHAYVHHLAYFVVVLF